MDDIRGPMVLDLVRSRIARYPSERPDFHRWSGPWPAPPTDQDGGCPSSADWRVFLDTRGADGWSSWARALEGAGRHLDARSAVAAARWFDPSRTVESILGVRPPDPPELGPGQRARSVASLRLRQRHWIAWGAQGQGCVELPRLMENECDESFSIRARIYRSLGQLDHLAAAPALREGLRDPHPFARAQAARSLGWLAEPTAIDALHALADRDPNAEVRRSAARAAQRIVGYWMYYGEWYDVGQSPSRAVEVMRDLAARGLAGFALEVPKALHPDARDDAALTALLTELAPHSLDPPDPHADERRYNRYFAEAERIEADLDAADVSAIPRWLEASDDDRLHALDVIGRRRLREYEPAAAALASMPDPLGWTARRTVRRLQGGAWLRHDHLPWVV